jgi:DNA polymerase-3 subunit alpha
MAAMLSSELGNSDKVAHFVAECEAMGLHVLGPDVNESREMFTPVGGKIRFGLAGIKGVGELAAQRIIAEREANGPFATLTTSRRGSTAGRSTSACSSTW